MSLRLRILLITSLIVIALIAVSYTISSVIVLDGVRKVEQQYVQENVSRARDAIGENISQLQVLVSDWSAWDPTYVFVSDRNQTYIDENLNNYTFTDLNVNLFVIVNSANQVVLARSFDLSRRQEDEVPPELARYLGAGSPLVKFRDTSSKAAGIILLPKGPLLVASQPILPTDKNGPSQGALLMGRYLDTVEIQRLSALTHLDIGIFLRDSSKLPADVEIARSNLSPGSQSFIRPLSQKEIAGYTVLNDINGQPALILRLQADRDFYSKGWNTIYYLLLSLLVVGLVFGEATLLFLERLVLSRLSRLQTEVSAVGSSGNLSTRVTVTGKDELTRLAAEVNSMLAALEESQNELRATHEQLEQRVLERTAELRQVAERLSAVNRIARASSATLDIDELMEAVYKEAAPLFQCDAFFIALYDEATGELDFRLQVDEEVRDPPQRVPLGNGLTAQVVTQNTPLLVHNFSKERKRLPPTVSWGTHKIPSSWLGVPMRVGQRVVGVISIQAYHPQAYGEGDQWLLSLIADQVAVAADNARLYTATRARADELSMLNEIGTSLTSTLDFPAVVRTALVNIQQLFQGRVVSLLQADSWVGDLRFAQTLKGEALVETPLQAESGEGLAGWALQYRQPVLVEHARSDPRFSDQVDQAGDEPDGGGMAVPLATPDQAIGVIQVIGEPGAYSGDHLRTLQAIASIMTVALMNARLYNEVTTLLREREQAQAQLIHAEKMTALGRLVASIAHEINNPLQALQVFVTLIEEGMADPQRQQETQEYLEATRREIERISTIVLRMRDFYRPAREGLQGVDLYAVLESVLELTGKQLEHSHITVQRNWAPDLPEIEANPDHLKQVFLNLVLNAIDAMPQQGTLSIRTRMDQVQRADQEADQAVCIQVGDTGMGMAPEVLFHLFEPFFTTKPFGSGLGLSISYGIIQSHNGTITVDSKENEGTTFTILLPVRQP